MTNLLSFENAQKRLILADNLKETFNNFIKTVEEINLIEIIGQNLYDALKIGHYPELKKLTDNYTIFYAYDLFLRNANLKNTVFGAVVKNGDYSQNDKTERTTQIESNIKIAFAYEKKLVDYLEKNNIPEWNGSKKRVPIANIKITPLVNESIRKRNKFSY